MCSADSDGGWGGTHPNTGQLRFPSPSEGLSGTLDGIPKHPVVGR